jgi:hypothetical protein
MFSKSGIYVYYSKQLFTIVNMNKKITKQDNRHMVAIPDSSYVKIAAYTDEHSYIMGKWIGKVCESFIETETSASYRK